MSADAATRTLEHSRALVLTFDNLGEANELEHGNWPAGQPLGHHPSVVSALPRLLDALDADGLSATFFVEAINCDLYPETLMDLVARGHEVGMHGWRHEQWGALSAGHERELLKRGLDAFARLGLPVRGFRPPGGELTDHTPALLREHGFTWCSPAGTTASVHDGLAFVPFAWELVDAYHLMERFRDLRGDSNELTPSELTDLLTAVLGQGDDVQGPQTLVLHPFLMLDEAWWEGVREVLGLIARQVRDGRVWAGRGDRLAAGSAR